MVGRKNNVFKISLKKISIKHKNKLILPINITFADRKFNKENWIKKNHLLPKIKKKKTPDVFIRKSIPQLTTSLLF